MSGLIGIEEFDEDQLPVTPQVPSSIVPIESYRSPAELKPEIVPGIAVTGCLQPFG